MKISAIALTSLLFSLFVICGCKKVNNPTGLPTIETVVTLQDLVKTPVFEMPDGAKFHLGIDSTRANQDGFVTFYCLLVQEQNHANKFEEDRQEYDYSIGPIQLRKQLPEKDSEQIHRLSDSIEKRPEAKTPILFTALIKATQNKTFVYDIFYSNKTIASVRLHGQKPKSITFFEFYERDAQINLEYPATPALQKYISLIDLKREVRLADLFIDKQNTIKLSIDKNIVALSCNKPVFLGVDSFLVRIWINGIQFNDIHPNNSCQQTLCDSRTKPQKTTKFSINWQKTLYDKAKTNDRITVQFVLAPFGSEHIDIFSGVVSLKELIYREMPEKKIIYSNKYTFTYHEEDYKNIVPYRDQPVLENDEN